MLATTSTKSGQADDEAGPRGRALGAVRPGPVQCRKGLLGTGLELRTAEHAPGSDLRQAENHLGPLHGQECRGACLEGSGQVQAPWAVQCTYALFLFFLVSKWVSE